MFPRPAEPAVNAHLSYGPPPPPSSVASQTPDLTQTKTPSSFLLLLPVASYFSSLPLPSMPQSPSPAPRCEHNGKAPHSHTRPASTGSITGWYSQLNPDCLVWLGGVSGSGQEPVENSWPLPSSVVKDHKEQDFIGLLTTWLTTWFFDGHGGSSRL